MWQRQEYDRPDDVLFARPTNRAIKSGMLYEDEKPSVKRSEQEGSSKRDRTPFTAIKLQSIICCVVLALTVAVKIFMPEFFAQLGAEYARLMSFTLSEQEQQTAFALTDEALAILGDEPQADMDDAQEVPSVDSAVQEGAEEEASQLSTSDDTSQEQETQALSEDAPVQTDQQTTNAQGAPDVVTEQFALVDEQYTLSIPIVPPMQNGSLTSGFGVRVSPINGEEEFHSGIDLVAPQGSEIVAVADGIVEVSGFDSIGGHYVKILHDNGFESGYYHLDSRSVEIGEAIKAGETLGIIGTTGQSTGVHLHMTFTLDGMKVDPLFAYPEGTFE